MKKIVHSLVLSVSVLGLLSGCAPRLGGNDYALGGTGEIGQTFTGVITSARPVNLTGQNAAQDGKIGAGALGGAAVGGIAGSLIGKGKTPWITGALGALGGGFAGQAIERQATQQQGMEYAVQLDQGGTVTIAQGLEPALAAGQRVRVIHSAKDRSRVVPA